MTVTHFYAQDGKPCPLLPALQPKYAGRKCLVLDLDETLVHSSLRVCFISLSVDDSTHLTVVQPVPAPDYIVPVEIENNWHNFYVLKRPGVDNFLRRMGELYEVVVFTASLSKVRRVASLPMRARASCMLPTQYADPVLDRLDPGSQSVAHRLFRESCYNHRGNYVKVRTPAPSPIALFTDRVCASRIYRS